MKKLVPPQRLCERLALAVAFLRSPFRRSDEKMFPPGRGAFQVALLSFVLFLAGPSEAAPPCKKLSETCIDGPATKTISGISITRPCWRYEAQFECATNTYQNFCDALEKTKNCTLVNQTCAETDTDGVCRVW